MLAAAVLGQQNAGPAVFEIAATATTASTTRTTSHTVNLPAGVGAGDVLIVVTRTTRSSVGASTMSGYAIVASTTDGFSLHEVFARVADGSEGATVGITFAGNQEFASVAYRITGAHGDVEATAAEGTADPPSITPSWGSAENIWITTLGHRQGTTSATNPTGYANQLRADGGLTSNDNPCIYSADRVATATTEDPSTWSLSGTNERNNVTTIAVRPA